MSLLTRFWDKVDKNGPVMKIGLGPCWIWTACKDSWGYGCIRDDAKNGGRRLVASRLSLIWHTGLDQPELFCMHKCNNPPCVNPAHLRWGTHQENMDQMKAEGRANNGTWKQADHIEDPKPYGVLESIV